MRGSWRDAALALSAAAVLCVATRAGAESDLGPAARVNGVEIDRASVQNLVKGLARAESSPPDSERIAELTRSALESLIDLELLYQEAIRQQIELPPGEVDRQVAAVRQHFDSDEAFAAALAERGLTPESLRIDTMRTLMADRLLHRTVWRDLSVSSEEVEQFYEANRAALSRPFEELQDSIARMLLDDKKSARRAELVADLRKRATIERLPPYGTDPAVGAEKTVTPATREEAEGRGRRDR